MSSKEKMWLMCPCGCEKYTEPEVTEHVERFHSEHLFQCRVSLGINHDDKCDRLFWKHCDIIRHIEQSETHNNFRRDYENLFTIEKNESDLFYLKPSSRGKLAQDRIILYPADLIEYRCKKCKTKKKFFSSFLHGSAIKHVQQMHPDHTHPETLIKFKCRVCYIDNFFDQEDFKEHVDREHRSKAESSQWCSFCPNKVPKSESSDHLKSHFNCLFKCATCKFGFEEYSEVKEHMKSVHKIEDDYRAFIELPKKRRFLRLFKCGVPDCARKFISHFEDLKPLQHMEKMHGYHDSPENHVINICRICEDRKNFDKLEELEDHIWSRHPTELFAQDSSEKVARELDEDIRIEKTREKYEQMVSELESRGAIQCFVCDDNLQKEDLKNHLKDKHPLESFRCVDCPQHFKTMDVHKMSGHLKSIHSFIKSKAEDFEYLTKDEHILLPQNLTYVKCQLCVPNKILVARDEEMLKSHILLNHNEVSPEEYISKTDRYFEFFCRICGKDNKMTNLATVHYHIENNHKWSHPNVATMSRDTPTKMSIKERLGVISKGDVTTDARRQIEKVRLEKRKRSRSSEKRKRRKSTDQSETRESSKKDERGRRRRKSKDENKAEETFISEGDDDSDTEWTKKRKSPRKVGKIEGPGNSGAGSVKDPQLQQNQDKKRETENSESSEKKDEQFVATSNGLLCTLCNITTTGQGPMNMHQHLQGKKHKQRLHVKLSKSSNASTKK